MQGTAADLFVDLGAWSQEYAPGEPLVVRERGVGIEFGALGAPAPGGTGWSPAVRLKLFDDVDYVALLDRIESVAPGSTTWIGHLDGLPLHRVTMAFKDGVLVGNVRAPEALYQVTYSPDGIHLVKEIDTSQYPPEKEPTPVDYTPEQLAKAANAPLADDGSVIDVLVVYTADARVGAGGTAAMESTIALAISETNTSYSHSSIHTSLHLVHSEEVAYSESGALETDRNRLQNDSDGFMDAVHELRDEHAADVVTLIVESGDACGIAYIMEHVSTAFEDHAFNVVARDCATGYYSFGHEIGHIQSARHDWFVDGTNNSPYSYNHAYVDPGDQWRTIMAYGDDCGDCTRLDYWSNPNINAPGTSDPMGIPEGQEHAAENWKTLNNTALTVANFRSTQNITFCIDDTGSMSEEINYAKQAAITVIDANEDKGGSYYYTLFTFKDGPATLRGQSSDPDEMKALINTLGADGGDGCPESSLTAIRQAAGSVPDAGIMMMTDASSNSYGQDDTYATWGEVLETVFALLENKCRLHAIVYSTCGKSASAENDGGGNRPLQAARCPVPPLAGMLDSPSGEEGYNRVCTESGGLYFRINTGQTAAAVEIILREASATGTIAFYDGNANGTALPCPIPVDATIDELLVVLNGNAGSAVTLSLENPLGEAVDGTTPGVSVIAIGGTTFYSVDTDALAAAGVGQWMAIVDGTGEFRLGASCETTNPMEYSGETSVGIGGTLHLQAALMQEVTNVQFELVSLGGASVTPVTLFDDGMHGDGQAGDLRFAGTHVVAEAGSYRFRTIADAEFQRMNTSKITAGHLEVLAPPSRNILAGESISVTFEVTNLGTEEDTFDIYASSSAGWSDLSGVPAVLTLSGGETRGIEIPVNVPAGATTGDFDKLSMQGVSQGNLLISDTDETTTTVAPPVPVISVDPEFFNFEQVEIGDESLPGVFTISNVGAVDLTIIGLEIDDSLHFGFDSGTCGAPPITLAPGENCTVGVTFHPKAVGPLEAHLTVDSDDPFSPTKLIPLYGTGEGCACNACPPLLIDSVVCFSALDGSDLDEDGIADGVLMINGLVLEGWGKILIDVPEAELQLRGDVQLFGDSRIENDSWFLPDTGPDITVVTCGSIVLSDRTRIRSLGNLGGGQIKLCAEGDVVMNGIAGIESGGFDMPEGVQGGVVDINAGNYFDMTDILTYITVSAANAGEIHIAACGTDDEAVRVKGRLLASSALPGGCGGVILIDARKGGLWLPAVDSAVATGVTHDGEILLWVRTVLGPPGAPWVSPDPTVVFDGSDHGPCTCESVSGR